MKSSGTNTRSARRRKRDEVREKKKEGVARWRSHWGRPEMGATKGRMIGWVVERGKVVRWWR